MLQNCARPGSRWPLVRGLQSERAVPARQSRFLQAVTEPMSEKRLAHPGWPIWAAGRFSNR
jgi:hypothetical protein